jgi:hypothetical protein
MHLMHFAMLYETLGLLGLLVIAQYTLEIFQPNRQEVRC